MARARRFSLLRGWGLKLWGLAALFWLLLSWNAAEAARPRSGAGWIAVVLLGPPLLMAAELVLEAALEGISRRFSRARVPGRVPARRFTGAGDTQGTYDVAKGAGRRRRRSRRGS